MSPQPNLPQYPISALYTVPAYTTIADALAAGVPVGPGGIEMYNPALPVKTWLGGGALNFFSGNAYGVSATEITLTIPVTSTGLNIPGEVPLPAYVVAPTTAVMESIYTGTQPPIDAGQLSSLADALALVAAVTGIIPGTISYRESSMDDVPLYTPLWNGETRRLNKLTVNGKDYGYVGNWVSVQNAAGVGAPGKWFYGQQQGDAAAGNQLQWQNTPQVLVAPAGAVTMPTPVRPLLPNEEFVWVPAMSPLQGVEGVWMVQRTDMSDPLAAARATLDAAWAAYKVLPGATVPLALD